MEQNSKKLTKVTALRALPVGSDFEVFGLETLFRNLHLVSVNDSCAGVKGEILENKSWKPLGNHYFSPRTEVVWIV